MTSDLDLVVEEIRTGERFLLTTHENPDGDALGSLLATQRILEALGKDSLMFLAAKEFPLPVEYRFLPLDEVFHEPPADISDRVVIFLDCGNIDRMPVDFLRTDGTKVINIDHHHDNTRFGTVNLVDVDASCTAEILYDLARMLGVELTAEIANALYVALVTDTGKFMYENTDARSHRMAAGLIEAGVNVNEIYRRLYEHAPIEKLRLLAHALDQIELRDDGRLSITYISADDYAATGASEALTEGVIDHLRTIDGTLVAAVVRDQPRGPGRSQGEHALHRRAGRRLGHRASPRRRRPPSRRRLWHRSFLRADRGVPGREINSQLDAEPCPWGSRAPPGGCWSTSRQGSPHTTSSRRCGASAGQGGPRRHARPVRHRAAGPPARAGHPPCSATCWSCRRPTGRRRGWAGAQHRRPRRGAHRDRADPASALGCPPEECDSGCR